jgi:hypothetical protein
MSPAVFYVLAVLVVAAALFAVVVPSIRLVLVGVVATDVMVGALLMAAGAYVLGAVVVVAPALCLLGVSALLQRAGYRALFADLPPFARRWQWGAGVCAGIGLLLVWTATDSAGDTVSVRGSPALITVLHYRVPVSVGVAVALAVASVAGALFIGRTGEDERRLDHAAEQRRMREQRTAARRGQRAAARAQRERRGEGIR